MSADTATAQALTVFGAPEGADALLLIRRRAEHTGSILHIARDDQRMARLAEALTLFAPDHEVLRFPAWDCLPYDRVSPNAALVAERIATLARLLELPAPRQPRIVLSTVNALIQRVPPPGAFTGAALDLVAGGDIRPEQLAAFLEAHGYGRAGTVMEPGEYAMRGGIIDIFPAGQPEPVRLDLFGDTIEHIRRFDPATQRSSQAKLQRLVLRPMSEVPMDKEAIARFRAGWRERFGNDAAADPLYTAISDGRRQAGMEHYLPLFHERLETLAAYLPDAAISLDHQAEDALSARLEMIADHYAARRAPAREGEVPYRPLPPAALYLDQAEWQALLAAGPCCVFSPFAKSAGATGIDAGGRPGPLFTRAADAVAARGSVFEQLRPALARWSEDGRRVAIAAWSRGSRERLSALLREHGFRDVAVVEDGAGLAARPPGSL